MKTTTYYQNFIYHNSRVISRGDKDEKTVTKFKFGALITKFIENFPDDLPECDKVKCIIDNHFEKTKLYLYG